MSDLPRLLWIPHAPWEQCQAQRPWELVRGLLGRFDVHVLTWAARPPTDRSRRWYYLNPMNHWHAMAPAADAGGSPAVHRASVTLPIVQGFLKSYPPQWSLLPAQTLFRWSVRRLHRRQRFDAAVVSASHHWTGYPPRLPGLPTLFDYVDTSPPAVEAVYVRAADRVVAVSHVLKDRVSETYGRETVVIPNGLHLERHRKANGGRERWGLHGKRVVSLIGLTCSSRLYFLDALARLRPEFPDLIFVAAGAGTTADRIGARCRDLGLPAVMTGWIDPADVPDLFAATDVGLYPGDDNPYFDGACPLKVLEYAGAGKPVVVNCVAELIRLGFPNLVVCPATAEGFEDGIRAALSGRAGPAPDMTPYDWPAVAARFGDEIDRLLTRAGAHPMKTVMVICGTRPEAIKLAPVVIALRARPDARVVLCATGQHRELLDSVLAVFGLTPDADLNVMTPGQHLTDLLARMLAGLRGVIRDVRPDAVLVQGDTTTAMAGALAAFADRVPVGHVEAGLRTYDNAAPFPEEANRRVVGVLADRHFAPTPTARDNLLSEQAAPASVVVTGNTVVDALWWVRDRLTPADRPAYVDPTRRLILLTAHRRESFGIPLRRALRTIRQVVEAFPDVQVVYPVHPNPEVKAAAAEELGGHPRVTLTTPTDYRTTVWLMTNAHLILTDSGGIQEEAPSLGRPVLVLRDVSERPEGVRAGVVRLVGTDRHRIFEETSRLLTDPVAHRAASRVMGVYGDGLAAWRIAEWTLDGRTELPEFQPAC